MGSADRAVVFAIEVIVYFLAAYGFAFAAGHSKISDVPRAFLWGLAEGLHHGDLPVLGRLVRGLVLLVECPGCVGWWTGLAFGAAAGLSVIGVLMLAFATCGCNTYLALRSGLIQRPGDTPRFHVPERSTNLKQAGRLGKVIAQPRSTT